MGAVKALALAGNAPAERDIPTEIALPEGAPGNWCRLIVEAESPGKWWAKYALWDSARGHVVRQGFLGPARRRGTHWQRSTMIYMPPASESLSVQLFGEGASLRNVHIATLSRRAAFPRLLVHGLTSIPAAASGDTTGLAGRLRAVVGQSPARNAEAPPYELWVRLFDTWSAQDREDLMTRLQAMHLPPFGLAIAGASGATPDALRRTRESLARQWITAPAPPVLIEQPSDWLKCRTQWTGIIQAGEILPDHALACMSFAIVSRPALRFVCADTDEAVPARPGWTRANPRFKPGPGPVLLPSGALTTGLCFFRAREADLRGLPLDAGQARLQLATRLVTPAEAAGNQAAHRIPLILTHTDPLAQAALLPATAKTSSAGQPGEPSLRPPSVSVIIPTAARAPHVLRCIRRTALLTDYPDLEIIVALSAAIENDWTQQEIVRALSRLPRVRVIDLALAGFNYAEAINRTAEQARGDYLLLLNDDVAPQEPDWLHRMATLLTAPVRIAGARLLYGNDTIQHGGVTMGLADLCEHSGRFWSPDDPGPAGIGLLDRDVSAVTAACLLVENSLFRELGRAGHGVCDRPERRRFLPPGRQGGRRDSVLRRCDTLPLRVAFARPALRR